MKDTFGREISYLRLSVTESCNLRCRYCMPEGDESPISRENRENRENQENQENRENRETRKSRADWREPLTEDEMVLAVEAAASLGFWKLRLTGGEPLLYRNLPALCTRLAGVRGIREVCLTTNGTLLSPLASPLRRAGLDRVNISLDTLDPEKYRLLTRGGTLSRTLAGIESALEAGFSRVKLNVVLLGGWNEGEIPDLAALSVRYPLDVRFIEWMPMTDRGNMGGGAIFPADGEEPEPEPQSQPEPQPESATMLPCETVLRRLPALEPLNRLDGVARLYRLPGAQGTVGLISPVSRHFCGTCDRLRLTADGHLKPCLHTAAEYSVKGLDFQGIREQFRRAVLAKPPCHGTLSPSRPSSAGRAMNRIGG